MSELSPVQHLITSYRLILEARRDLESKIDLSIEDFPDVPDHEEQLLSLICRWPCQSIADGLAKIDLADLVFEGDEGMGATYLKILHSIKTVAVK